MTHDHDSRGFPFTVALMQRCGLESHDLDSSQTRVINLMTLDST